MKDLGEAGAAALLAPEKFHRVELELAGERLTMTEIARVLGEAWHVSPEAPDLTPEQAIAQGMPPVFVRNYQMLEEVGSPATPEQARSLGLPLTDFRTWAHSVAGVQACSPRGWTRGSLTPHAGILHRIPRIVAKARTSRALARVDDTSERSVDWTDVLEKMDALFPDTKVYTEVRELLAEWNYRLEWDETETIVMPPDLELFVKEKSLVRDTNLHGSGYFMVRVILGPDFHDGQLTHMYTVGILDIMYDIQGVWLDEFFRYDKRLLSRR